MNEGFAATVAVPAWTMFMKRATADAKPDWFKPPLGVRRVALCRLSGQLATDECRLQGEVYDEYVVTGTVSPCSRHRPPAGPTVTPSD